MPRSVLGLDVGGANLKAAHSAGATRLVPFALWKSPADLPAALRELVRPLPAFDLLAVTMTGELCDCFETKREGVNAILDAVTAVAGNTPVLVWRTDGRFASLDEARRTSLLTAASNWLALATFAGRYAPRGPALLIDIGSTTTDIVPLHDGRPVPQGRTDPERLRCGELVYTGIRRTPLCALLGGEGAAELFATTLDVYLVLGALDEDATDRDTADGRPATRAAARARLARMLCADLETSTEEQRRSLVLKAAARQMQLVTFALERVAKRLPGLPQAVVLAGSGDFLAATAARQLWGDSSPRVVHLEQELGSSVSHAACAYALAVLAQEHAREGG
jgi:probable H4MPT-linked C1 transfer pathway protein